jgi:hypothetical protein
VLLLQTGRNFGCVKLMGLNKMYAAGQIRGGKRPMDPTFAPLTIFRFPTAF